MQQILNVCSCHCSASNILYPDSVPDGITRFVTALWRANILVNTRFRGTGIHSKRNARLRKCQSVCQSVKRCTVSNHSSRGVRIYCKINIHINTTCNRQASCHLKLKIVNSCKCTRCVIIVNTRGKRRTVDIQVHGSGGIGTPD